MTTHERRLRVQLLIQLFDDVLLGATGVSQQGTGWTRGRRLTYVLDDVAHGRARHDQLSIRHARLEVHGGFSDRTTLTSGRKARFAPSDSYHSVGQTTAPKRQTDRTPDQSHAND
jgi:hypothetical protein